MTNLIDQDILSDDVCRCSSCSAILFMPLFGKYIPITQKQLDEILYPNTFLRYFLNRPTNRAPYIYPSYFILE